jgi:hypothetical protein
MYICSTFSKQSYFPPLCKNTLAYYNDSIVVVNAAVKGFARGANPTIVSYNTSAVKFYDATNSLVRFESKNIFFCIICEKRSTTLAF